MDMALNLINQGQNTMEIRDKKETPHNIDGDDKFLVNLRLIMVTKKSDSNISIFIEIFMKYINKNIGHFKR